MNKYINNLTVAEYENIEKWLKRLEPIMNKEMKETQQTKDYIELRFTIIKIQKIIKKYKKTVDNKPKIQYNIITKGDIQKKKEQKKK